VVTIDLAGGEGTDGHEVRMPRSCRPVLAARANAPAARVAGFASLWSLTIGSVDAPQEKGSVFFMKIHAR
jgi:hypothetical protein